MISITPLELEKRLSQDPGLTLLDVRTPVEFEGEHIEGSLNVPLDKIVVETDCPYLTPKAEGDKRNEPIFVKHVIQKIADLRVATFEEIASATTQNAKKLFGL